MSEKPVCRLLGAGLLPTRRLPGTNPTRVPVQCTRSPFLVHLSQRCSIAVMLDRVWLGAALGFVLFGIGGIGYAYMDYSVHGARMFLDFKRGSPIGAYRRMLQARSVPAWPVYLVGFIPLGVVVAFGSILLSDHLR